jgi:hypothetical protein
MILCTESFTLKENIILLNVLIIKFRLDCTLHKAGASYNISIRQNSMPLLRTIVSPYIHSSILYKLGIK